MALLISKEPIESLSITTPVTVYDVFENRPEAKGNPRKTGERDLTVFQAPSYIALFTGTSPQRNIRTHRWPFRYRQNPTPSKTVTFVVVDHGVNSELTCLSQRQDSDLDEEEPIWRGVFALSHNPKVLFSTDIEVKVNELPAWEPRVVIDSYRLEDDDE